MKLKFEQAEFRSRSRIIKVFQAWDPNPFHFLKTRVHRGFHIHERRQENTTNYCVWLLLV